jgi:flavin-binding protein dodecin
LSQSAGRKILGSRRSAIGGLAKSRSARTRPFSGKEQLMSSHTYKKIELVGSSPNSIQEAIENAVEKASQTIRNLRWFEVVETRGYIENNKVAHWQVTLKIGFTLEDDAKAEED